MKSQIRKELFFRLTPDEARNAIIDYIERREDLPASIKGAVGMQKLPRKFQQSLPKKTKKKAGKKKKNEKSERRITHDEYSKVAHVSDGVEVKCVWIDYLEGKEEIDSNFVLDEIFDEFVLDEIFDEIDMCESMDDLEEVILEYPDIFGPWNQFKKDAPSLSRGKEKAESLLDEFDPH